MVCAHRRYSIYRVCKLFTNLTKSPFLLSPHSSSHTSNTHPPAPLSPPKVRSRVPVYCRTNIYWSIAIAGMLHMRAQHHQAAAAAEARISPPMTPTHLVFSTNLEITHMQQELLQATEHTASTDCFQEHITQARNNNSTPLFPNNPMFREGLQLDPLTQVNPKHTPVVRNPAEINHVK